jgi:hypothetical protein
VRVAVLGTDRFEVSQVDRSGLNFHGVRPLRVSVKDVNGDGQPDLLAVFDTFGLKLHPRASVARLTGWLRHSRGFFGEDKIRIALSLVGEDSSCR